MLPGLSVSQLTKSDPVDGSLGGLGYLGAAAMAGETAGTLAGAGTLTNGAGEWVLRYLHEGRQGLAAPFG